MNTYAKQREKNSFIRVSDVCDKVGSFIIVLILAPVLTLFLFGGPFERLPHPEAPLFTHYLIPVSCIGFILVIVGSLCIFAEALLLRKEQRAMK